MLNGKDLIIHLIAGLIKKILYKTSHYFPKPYQPFRRNIKVKVDLSNYATKADLKNVTDVDTSKLAAKSEVDKLDVDKLKIVPDELSNLKSEVDKLDIGKLKTTPVDLSKLTKKICI